MEAGPRVFLCHASEDKPRVRRLYRQLRADNCEPWLDEKNLKAGEDWEQVIINEVRTSDVVVVCLSSRSIGKDGFVQKEIRVALDAADYKAEGRIYLIPIRLEKCALPTRLRKWQAIDLYKKGGYASLLRSLRSHGVTQCLWDASDDDETAPERDPGILQEYIGHLQEDLSPGLAEAIQQLEDSAEYYGENPSDNSLLEYCKANRLAWAYYFDQFATAGEPPPELTQRLSKALDDAQANLPKRPKKGKQRDYCDSIKLRATMMKQLLSGRSPTVPRRGKDHRHRRR